MLLKCLSRSSAAASKSKTGFGKQRTKAQGSATLENASFAITTLNENPVIVEGNSYTKGQVVLIMKTNADGIASTAKDALPFGHYRVDEASAPKGYLNEGVISIEFDITEDGKFVDLTAEDHSILNQVVRGDLEFVKVSDGEQKRLANVPFAITSNTTGESHTIITVKTDMPALHPNGTSIPPIPTGVKLRKMVSGLVLLHRMIRREL